MEARCYNHPDKEATETCHYCGRQLCSACLTLSKVGRYYSCSNQAECLAYQEGQELPVDPQAAVNDYILDEAALERCLSRLGQVQDELGGIREVFAKCAARKDQEESEQEILQRATEEKNKIGIPGFCAYKLAEEGMVLLNLVALRIDFLRRKYEQSGNARKLEELTTLQDHIKDHIEPLMHQTLEQMAGYSTIDAQSIAESFPHGQAPAKGNVRS